VPLPLYVAGLDCKSESKPEPPLNAPYDAVQLASPGSLPAGHQIGSPFWIMLAASRVARGTAVPVASNTTTGVPVGTAPTNVEVSVGATAVSVGAAVVSVGATVVSDVDGSVGATLVFVDTTVIAGAEVSVDATIVPVDAAVVAGAEVSAGATVVSVEATGVSDVDGSVGATLVSVEAAVVAGAEVLSNVFEVLEVGGEVGATGVLLSASAPNGFTALTAKTNKTVAVKK
jgi:hypothetical protein